MEFLHNSFFWLMVANSVVFFFFGCLIGGARVITKSIERSIKEQRRLESSQAFANYINSMAKRSSHERPEG